jgi:hypothetical protein
MSQAVPAPLRPPFIYYGGKQRTAAVIAGLLPAHTHYVEPFAVSRCCWPRRPRSWRPSTTSTVT